MYWVNKEGKVGESSGHRERAKFGIRFFYKWGHFTYSMFYEVVKNLSAIHKAVNYIIECNYTIHVDRVSRTEKNKGRDYMSSGYTVTAGISHKDRDIDTKEDMKIFDNYLFTFRDSSAFFIQKAAIAFPGIIHAYLVENQDEEFNECVRKDTQLYQLLVGEKIDTCWIEFNPVRIKGLREDTFNLDALDQSIYLSYATKFMEMAGNYSVHGEMMATVLSYEAWLFHVLNKYFRYEIISDFYDNEG